MGLSDVTEMMIVEITVTSGIVVTLTNKLLFPNHTQVYR